jgi:hypothetical protein
MKSVYCQTLTMYCYYYHHHYYTTTTTTTTTNAAVVIYLCKMPVFLYYTISTPLELRCKFEPTYQCECWHISGSRV